jgi:hypothetical protein
MLLFTRGGSVALAALASVAVSAADGTAGSQVLMAACQADVGPGLKMHLMVEASGVTCAWDLDYEKNDLDGGGSDGGSSFTPDDGSSYGDAACFDYLESCSVAGLCFGAADTVKCLAGRDIESDVRGSDLHFVPLFGLFLFTCFVFSCCVVSSYVSAIAPSTNLDHMMKEKLAAALVTRALKRLQILMSPLIPSTGF